MNRTSPLRIGIDIRKANPAESGQQRYLWRLGTWLGSRGHDVHFVTVKGQPPGTVAPGATHLHDLRRLDRTAIARAIGALELDVLLLNPERSRPFRGIRANVLRPAYGTEHYRQKLRSFRRPVRSLGRRLLRMAPWEVLERRWERSFYEAPDPPPDVIAVSHYMRDEILDSYRVPAEHVHVVHNGVDLQEFSCRHRLELRDEQRSAWGIPESAVCLLFMGHNYRLKGLWQLMEVVARLRAEKPCADLHLIAVGRGTGGSQRRAARRLASSLGLNGVLHLVGPVRPAIRAFAAADAFIHLSWHDSFGFVTLEAMASGLPVITTPYVGASEVIEDGVSGIVVDPRERGSVVGRVRELLDEGIRRRIGGAAARVGEAYSEEANFEVVSEIFRRAAARSNSVSGLSASRCEPSGAC